MGTNRWQGGIERRKRTEADVKARDIEEETPKDKKGDSSSRLEASEEPEGNHLSPWHPLRFSCGALSRPASGYDHAVSFLPDVNDHRTLGLAFGNSCIPADEPTQALYSLYCLEEVFSETEHVLVVHDE